MTENGGEPAVAIGPAWYIGAFTAHPQLSQIGEGLLESCDCWMLVSGDNAEAAYAKASELAGSAIRRIKSNSELPWEVDGIMELLLTIEEPASGSELTWEELEIPPDDLHALVKRKSDLLAFRSFTTEVSWSGWYVATLVYVEVHETGSHADCLLVWIDQHLIAAKDAESAYASAVTVGNEYATSSAHSCDGQPAHFEFKGLQELVRTTEEPADGAVLWIETLYLSPQERKSSVPEKSDLGVFRKE